MKYRELNIGSIVANDFRAAKIFKKHGIDFCCGGQQNFSDACQKKSLNVSQVEQEIDDACAQTISSGINFIEWDKAFLCDYIVNTHHKYVENSIPELLFYTNKIARVHGENHPELMQIAAKFEIIAETLSKHLKFEEDQVFPLIKAYYSGNSDQISENLAEKIEDLDREHQEAGSEMDEINLLAKGYSVPDDACTTYKVTFKLLDEFENDLHNHVHLENNILFTDIYKKNKK